MKITRKSVFKGYLEKYETEVKEAIFDHITSYIIEPVRHELWMYIDRNGEMSLKENIGYASQKISNAQRFFIYACGGENVTVWHLLPRINVLLGDDFDIVLEHATNATGKKAAQITVSDIQKYVEENCPGYITEWLDANYYSDPYGQLEDYVENYYENLLNQLDGWD